MISTWTKEQPLGAIMHSGKATFHVEAELRLHEFHSRSVLILAFARGRIWSFRIRIQRKKNVCAQSVCGHCSRKKCVFCLASWRTKMTFSTHLFPSTCESGSPSNPDISWSLLHVFAPVQWKQPLLDSSTCWAVEHFRSSAAESHFLFAAPLPSVLRPEEIVAAALPQALSVLLPSPSHWHLWPTAAGWKRIMSAWIVPSDFW